MALKKFDPIDAGLTVVTLMSAFMIVGIATFDLFDVDFSATLFTVAGFALSTAYVLAASSVVLTVLTNDNTDFSSLREDVRDLDQYYAAAIALTFGLLIAWPVFPQVQDFFSSEDLWGVVYVVTVTTGQMALGWML